MDDAKILEILARQPTIPDIEDASMWLGGDADIFGAGAVLRGVAGEMERCLEVPEWMFER